MTKGRLAKRTTRAGRQRSKTPADFKTENAQLRRELNEARQQQIAVSEVLQVISSSSGELEPVFQAMLGNAVRICEASFGALLRFEGGAWRSASMLGVPPAFAEYWRRGPQRPGPGTGLGRIVETRQTVHIADVRTEPAFVEGEPVFIEVNVNCDWRWFEHRSGGADVSAAVHDWVAGRFAELLTVGAGR